MKQKLRTVFNLFFSYEGTIGRLQYFGANFLARLILVGAALINIPAISLIFDVIYLYIALGLTQKRCRDLQYNATIFVIIMSLGYITLTVLGDFSVTTPYAWIEWLKVIILLPLIIAGLILTFQPGKNSHTDTSTSFLLKNPWVYVLSLFLLTLISTLTINIPSIRDDMLYTAREDIYFHRYGYTKACAENGYDLKVYPQKFAEIYHDDIAAIENYILKESSYKTIDEYYAAADKTLYPHIKDMIIHNLNLIKQQVTMEMIAQKSSTSVEELRWRPEYETILNIPFICKLLDASAEDILNDKETFSIITSTGAYLRSL